MPLNIEDHAYSVMSSGYTLLQNQIGESDIRALREAVDQALAAIGKAREQGRNYPIFNYPSTQCMYCWGDACLDLLEHETIHGLTAELMREYRLWGYNMLARAPSTGGSPPGALKLEEGIGLHQDFSIPFHGSPRPFYLWHFVCLDDVTPENGATWVVPGSHRATDLSLPKHGAHRTFTGGSAQQICAKAGDILTLNPCCYHTPGPNYSHSWRRYLAVQLCYITLPPLHDHWSIAGPSVQRKVSIRTRKMLRGDYEGFAYPHAASGYVLPDGWETDGNPFAEAPNEMGQHSAMRQLAALRHPEH
jgi:hypothetical protein